MKLALEWLKLNHADYIDLEIAYEKLEEYPEDTPPALVDYRRLGKEKNSENQAVYHNEDDEGTEEGDCPFSIHTLDASEVNPQQSSKQMKALALKHLADGKFTLGVGYVAAPESLYNNP